MPRRGEPFPPGPSRFVSLLCPCECYMPRLEMRASVVVAAGPAQLETAHDRLEPIYYLYTCPRCGYREIHLHRLQVAR